MIPQRFLHNDTHIFHSELSVSFSATALQHYSRRGPCTSSALKVSMQRFLLRLPLLSVCLDGLATRGLEVPFDGDILPAHIILQERSHEATWKTSTTVDVFQAKRLGDEPWIEQQDKRYPLPGIIQLSLLKARWITRFDGC